MGAHAADRTAPGHAKDVTGVKAVAAKLPFALTAPDTLVGLPRKDVRLLGMDGKQGALVTYGAGLGGIAVSCRPRRSRPTRSRPARGDRRGLSLPKISIAGTTGGQELATALGTVGQLRARRRAVHDPRLRAPAGRGSGGPWPLARRGRRAPVEARGLVKVYGDITAVDHVDLTVEAGDVYGYLGPNGAGKTTVLRMLLGLIRPTAGEVRLFGRDPIADGAARAATASPGSSRRRASTPTSRAARTSSCSRRSTAATPRARIDEALDIVELTDRQKHRVGGYSHGMRQRLGVAAALLRDPRLLLLDEPATGLDPAGMRDMRALIARLVARAARRCCSPATC